jgi:hypothetical protein
MMNKEQQIKSNVIARNREHSVAARSNPETKRSLKKLIQRNNKQYNTGLLQTFDFTTFDCVD